MSETTRPVHPDDVVSLAHQAKGNLAALKRILNHLAPDPEPPAVADLRTAARDAAVHHVTLGTSMGEHHEAWHRFAVSIADKVMSLVSPEIERLERDLAEARQQVAALEVQLPGVREDAAEARRSPGSRQCQDVEPHTDHVWDAGGTYPWCPGTT